MMSPSGLFQLQQHLQQQLMFAAAAGIQPNPALLAQALQAQAAYAAAAAAHGRGRQPQEVVSFDVFEISVCGCDGIRQQQQR